MILLVKAIAVALAVHAVSPADSKIHHVSEVVLETAGIAAIGAGAATVLGPLIGLPAAVTVEGVTVSTATAAGAVAGTGALVEKAL